VTVQEAEGPRGNRTRNAEKIFEWSVVAVSVQVAGVWSVAAAAAAVRVAGARLRQAGRVQTVLPASGRRRRRLDRTAAALRSGRTLRCTRAYVVIIDNQINQSISQSISAYIVIIVINQSIYQSVSQDILSSLSNEKLLRGPPKCWYKKWSLK